MTTASSATATTTRRRPAATTPPPAAAPVPTPTPATDTPLPQIARFPDFPPRNDMMNPRHLHDDAIQSALRMHLGNPDTTIVLGEVPIAREVAQGRAGVRIPDLLIAFNVRRARILAQQGYAISEQGKPPDFVLEVASNTTSRVDETAKLLDYAAFGVTEYWLFDPDWGRRYAQGLMGWTLVDNRYAAIPIYEYAPGRHCGYSAVLGLYVCWERGRLRWYDPVAGYLRTHDEERDERIIAESRLDAERDGRIVAETRLDAERERRIAAEAEAERLRNELARRPADNEGQ